MEKVAVKLKSKEASGAHGKTKDHPYGEKGEHKHEYIWNDDGTLKERKTGELSETDRKENGDIL